jgi:hypothetical protein
MDAKSTPLGRFIDEFGNRISTDGLTKIMAEHAALCSTVEALKTVDVPALLEASAAVHNEKLKDADPDSQFYGEDIVSIPAANKIRAALVQLEAVQHGKAKRKKKGSK